eukprot:gene7916-1128_t
MVRGNDMGRASLWCNGRARTWGGASLWGNGAGQGHGAGQAFGALGRQAFGAMGGGKDMWRAILLWANGGRGNAIGRARLGQGPGAVRGKPWGMTWGRGQAFGANGAGKDMGAGQAFGQNGLGKPLVHGAGHGHGRGNLWGKWAGRRWGGAKPFGQLAGKDMGRGKLGKLVRGNWAGKDMGGQALGNGGARRGAGKPWAMGRATLGHWGRCKTWAGQSPLGHGAVAGHGSGQPLGQWLGKDMWRGKPWGK